jgi:hypothetical protein
MHPAVASLVRRAQDQQAEDDLIGAALSLERALRIDPNEAELWTRLATVRLGQRDFQAVEQLAAKSNVLAVAGDNGLRARNWELIAEARRGAGDAAGAREAERQANNSRTR